MDIVQRLTIKSNMIFLGERIAFGSECELMDEAANEITKLRAQVEELSKDAGRYRWLKENYHGFKMFKNSPIPYVSLDSEVDKSMREKGK